MASETTGYSLLDQYRNISGKLKKRFLRKPNETEASAAFGGLAQQCESEELPQYAALSWIAAARCEGTLGNNVAETSYLLKAARQFLKAEEENSQTDCPSVSTEYLQAGLACYGHASSRYSEDSMIPLGLNLKIIDFLNKSHQPEFIRVYLENARELSVGQQDCHINCLELYAQHFIPIGDYVSALQIYQQISKLLEGIPMSGHRCNTLLSCEIYTIFLLLILKPSHQNLATNLAKVLEKYTWGDKSDVVLKKCKMSERLFILMQSLVTICQSADTSSLVDIEWDFWPFLSSQQKDLLRILIRMYCP